MALRDLQDTMSQGDYITVKLDIGKHLPPLVDFFCSDLANAEVSGQLRTQILQIIGNW